MLLLFLACPAPTPEPSLDSPTESPRLESPPDSEASAPRWTGEVSVLVIDRLGLPIEGAWVTQGGWPPERWVRSNAQGRARIEVDEPGLGDRYLMAGMEGWFNAGVEIPDHGLEGEQRISLRELPEADNLAYEFQAAGVGDSPDTSFCGHCHVPIADDWNESAHSRAASSTQVWDLYTGRSSEGDCEELGGQMAEGQVPGVEGSTQDYCYLGEQGVLPWLNDCESCDHPEKRDDLSTFGSCGGSNSPATDGATPGAIDLASSFGVAHEGVTCDFCHKIRSVEPGGAPGLDGAIELKRPSEEGLIGGLEFSPIIFGPYPDVTVALMNGTYNPQFREASFCSACHEYWQPALHPEQSLDEERWPQGLPVMTTFSEFTEVGADEAGFSCQGCHMASLDVESSTYDLSERGVEPSTTQGWLREPGEVKHHTFPRAEELGDPRIRLSSEGPGRLEVELTNTAAHQAPTGEPMRQILLLVSGEDASGEPLEAIGGASISDQGGYLATGRVDEVLEGSTLKLSGEGALVARFVRGELDSASVVGSSSVIGVVEGGVQLENLPADLQASDRVYLCAEGHYAGAPGKLYGKVLADAEGQRGVPHYRAVDMVHDERLPALGSASSEHIFPNDVRILKATLLRRDQAAPVADVYGWSYGDREGGSASMSLEE